ncbi:hypothetical protein Y032_0078g1152 [Ancylostoma ceylanicum]|uniref:Uncharacterized protein n=1 Tax=Ancylostoma ceylanicum TaxID=53326 RepID=A0A016TTR5_9BILA|nr:hypothetical protein Y032_0078g1152 [Ancylostoma ceylanicum]
MINLLSFPSHSGLSPGNSAIFCKRAEVVAARTVFLEGFVKVDHYVCLHCCAKPRNSVKSAKAKFPWVLPLIIEMRLPLQSCIRPMDVMIVCSDYIACVLF